MDILQHRVTIVNYAFIHKIFLLGSFSPFVVFVFVYVIVCVFVIVNICQQAVSIINIPQIYNRFGF